MSHIWGMRLARALTIVLGSSLVAALVALPATAQDDPPSLMERGAEMFFQGMIEEIQPALEDFAGMAREVGPRLQLLVHEMGPALTEIIGQIDDIRNYEPPAFLPNGDIILRRSPDAPPFKPPQATPDAEATPDVDVTPDADVTDL